MKNKLILVIMLVVIFVCFTGDMARTTQEHLVTNIVETVYATNVRGPISRVIRTNGKTFTYYSTKKIQKIRVQTNIILRQVTPAWSYVSEIRVLYPYKKTYYSTQYRGVTNENNYRKTNSNHKRGNNKGH